MVSILQKTERIDSHIGVGDGETELRKIYFEVLAHVIMEARKSSVNRVVQKPGDPGKYQNS